MAGKPIIGTEHKLRAFALREAGRSSREIGKVLGVSHVTVGNWLKHSGLLNMWEARKLTAAGATVSVIDPLPRISNKKHAATKSKVPKLEVLEMTGDLGLTVDTEESYTLGLMAGVSKRIAANHAGLTEQDVDGWAEEAGRGAEPFASAMRRILKRVATEVVAVAIMVKSGDTGYQARIRWLAARDPEAWSDKPQLKVSEQDRAAGMDDNELYEMLGVEPPKEEEAS